MAYYDEDDAIVARLIEDEPEFLATLFATFADYHDNPKDMSAVIDRAKLCHRLREQERSEKERIRIAEGEEMRAHYAEAARSAA